MPWYLAYPRSTILGLSPYARLTRASTVEKRNAREIALLGRFNGFILRDQGEQSDNV